MATFVQYQDFYNPQEVLAVERVRLTPLGYLAMNPHDALRKILPNYHVVEFQGIKIPSQSEFDNLNPGIRMSSLDDGIGLVGTVEMLEAQSELFRKSRRGIYTAASRQKIVERMKYAILPMQPHQEPLNKHIAQDHSFIFDLLGFPMPSEDIVKLSTHKDYGKPILAEEDYNFRKFSV